MSDRDLRMFACWCVRQAWHLLTDERSRHAVEIAERYVDGNASREELAAARASAWSAAVTAVEDNGAWYAACAALDSAGDAAGDAAGADARADEKEKQSEQLKNYPVDFSRLRAEKEGK